MVLQHYWYYKENLSTDQKHAALQTEIVVETKKAQTTGEGGHKVNDM